MDAAHRTRARGRKQPRASTTKPRRPRGPTAPERAVSLRFELDLWRGAAEGARLIADMIAYDGAPTATDRRVAPGAASAILSLLVERVRMVDLTLEGELGAHVLAAPHNTVTRTGDERDAEDVFLPLSSRRGS